MAVPDFATIPVYELWGQIESPEPLGWRRLDILTDLPFAIASADAWPDPRVVVQIQVDGTRSVVHEAHVGG